MRKISKIGAVLATTGLAAFGAVAGSGGAAHAATNLALASCDLGSATITSAAVSPSCTAGTSTIYNPTGIKLTVDPSFFTELLGNSAVNGLLGGALSENVTYDLTCVVNGAEVTSTTDTGFTVDSAADNTHAISLQHAVGSPAPGQCTLANLKVSSLLGANVLNELSTLGLSFTFGVSAAADNGTPGAIYSEEASDKAGAVPATCIDDTNNDNAGTTIQAFTCESDLAQMWLQASTKQFVHNGDCLNDVGGAAELSDCVANPGNTNSQVWNTTPKRDGYVEVVNSRTGQCLTDAKPADGTTITVAACTGASDQLWKVPAATPV
jgi:hypothetical protein